MCLCSFSFCSVFVGQSQPDGQGFCWQLWWLTCAPVGDESMSKSWSVCVGFLYTLMLRSLSSSVCTVQSKKGRLSPLTSSRVNLVLLSTAFICSVKASTSLGLIWPRCRPHTWINGLEQFLWGWSKFCSQLLPQEVGHYWKHLWAHDTVDLLYVETFTVVGGQQTDGLVRHKCALWWSWFCWTKCCPVADASSSS